jgi:aspartyl-tRNA(Asn)/glutamyl-tRNA(Gln) amidotransferase subunit A
MTATDPWLSLTGLADAYREGAIKPSAVVEAHLERIARLDPAIGAWQAVYADEAHAAAEAADKAIASGHRNGPFHGVPFGLKDIIDLEGRVTTGGSLALKDRVSAMTGTIARRLLSAGGILLGKTKTVELAFGGWGTNQRMGTPRNPWDMEVHRVCGGSSSGSAAAVAAGMAVCAVGTDTGGSVRLPAGFCGLTGLKVTERRLPADGILPLSQTLDTPGPMARSVADAALMFEVMDGREGWRIDAERRDRTGLWAALAAGARGLRLGAMAGPERAVCEPEMLAAYDAALERLRGLGAEIAIFESPIDFERMKQQNGRLIAAEGWFNHGHLFGDPAQPMDEDVRPRFQSGREVSASDYMALLADRAANAAALAEAMRGFDAVLTPATTGAAIPVAEADQSISPGHFTRIFNWLGMCGLALPMGLTKARLPLGLQVAARGGDEAMALRIGAALEGAQPPLAWPELG